MPADTWIVMRLEIDRDADPIAGTLVSAGHEERAFTGWLGLTDAIEKVRGETRQDAEAAEEQGCGRA